MIFGLSLNNPEQVVAVGVVELAVAESGKRVLDIRNSDQVVGKLFVSFKSPYVKVIRESSRPKSNNENPAVDIVDSSSASQSQSLAE